jgi:hypothetical protein
MSTGNNDKIFVKNRAWSMLEVDKFTAIYELIV